MKVSATIAARVGSSRLPRKVLLPILGRPMLELQIERIRQSALIDEVIVATPDTPENDVLEELAARMGVHCFRGSEHDVIGRITGALRHFDVELHVEFQGDSPMPDPALVDAFIGLYLKHEGRYDLVTNAMKTTYPPGLEVTVHRAGVLFEAEALATDAALREHVMIHIHNHPERFRTLNVTAPPSLHFPDVHLEVDTEADYEVIKDIFTQLYPRNPAFSGREAVDLALSSGMAAKNRDVERRWRVFRHD